jgi:hypothetical protein
MALKAPWSEDGTMAISKKVLLIIGVFAAAAIIIVAAASLNGKEREVIDVNEGSDDQGNTETIDVPDKTTTTVHQASNLQMSTVVNEIISVNGSESSPLEIKADPFEGNRYVILNVSVTNHLEEELSIISDSWNLYTSDDLMNTITANVASDIPDVIPAGVTVTFHMPFEIVADAAPTMLEYWGADPLIVDLV